MTLTLAEAPVKLDELRALPEETEWAEFKENNYNPEEVGEYLSALSNAAALHGKPAGYITRGVENVTHKIVGTTFKPRKQKGAGNEDLEPWLTRLLSPRVDFTILEFTAGGFPVVMFEVQAANTTPVRFKDNEWVRVGSHKKKLREHPEKARKLWRLLSGPTPDYSQNGRINFVEEDDSLLFTNLGHFIPESVERVIERDAPEEQYRNSFLVQAMVELNMIDTIGSGIKRMFRRQKERFLPMPDYDLTDPQRVKVRIIGKILDERFTRLLISRTDLPLDDAIALDKVQKRRPIEYEVYRVLKRRGLIEGRKSAPYISAAVAEVIGQEADYLQKKGFDKADCKRKVVDYLNQFDSAVRRKLEEVLFPVLSSALNEQQKRSFVKNLIQEMKQDGTIRKSHGERSDAVWVLSKPDTDEPS